MPFVFKGRKPGPKPLPAKPRLMARCDRSGGPRSCWTWTAGRFSDGYGQIRVGGRPSKAHRVAWVVFKGPIPKGKIVCHSCDNRACVNPRHLFLGTHKDNMDDMKSKGRDRRVGPKDKIGSKHKDAKLTERDVLKMRHLRATAGTPTRVLSSMFGVCTVQVNCILRRRYWKHI